jgi:chromosome segregation ATPase
MYILDKLKLQIQTLQTDYKNLQMQNVNLQNKVDTLKDIVDLYTYNNENMLLNIDKTLDAIAKEEIKNEQQKNRFPY